MPIIGNILKPLANEFILTNSVLKEYNKMKKGNQKRKGLIRLSELATRKFIKYFSLFIKQCYRIAWSLKIKIK